ncbi:uncharacterized protein LOC141677491 [Apium graveolens]|uniref:uncharacterized protein LOC141677491 n=1 Tax=Apium graveolens TaxID=4045 RepID=UPI003D79D2DE
MKVCVKLQQQDHTKPKLQNSSATPPLLLRTKIPIAVFGFPFLTGFTTSDHSSLSLSLRTNFPCGPSLKLSYSPSSNSPSPLTLSLKSGVSLSGSPTNSPLVISANFSFTPFAISNPAPTFSLQFKPHFGDFSLRKCVFSDPKDGKREMGSVGFLRSERSRNVWRELGLEGSEKESIFSGVRVMANTKMAVAKRVGVNLRWGVCFPGDFSNGMPYLSVNKISIERVDEFKEKKVSCDERNVGDSEMLKGMLSWMKRELESLRRDNQEMKCNLQELKSKKLVKRSGGGEKSMPVVQNTSGFDQWRNKKRIAEENQKELKKVEIPTTDVESELHKAIMAASSS